VSLARNAGTVGGLTAVSRVFGFLRDMLMARLLGAGLVADAFQLAFVLPNTFRRLFAEGAFSVAFVPMYTRALEAEGDAAATRFAAQVLSIFVWVLAAVSVLAMLAMPWAVDLLAGDFREVAGKFALTVALARITFPYLALISLVAMLSGLLNARGRFAPGAATPLILNFVLLGAIGAGALLRRAGYDDPAIGFMLGAAVTVAGAAQLVFMVWQVRRAGVVLKLAAPRLTPEVRRLALRIVPATAGAGIYQASQFVDTFFATSLQQGSLTLLKYADRLEQLPIGVIGMALGTAILPMLARHIHADDDAGGRRLQAEAIELATLLTLPAAAALAVCAHAFVAALFVGGRFTPGDGAVMSEIVVALVSGLPAYVLVKVLQPAFFSRGDTGTPMWVAGGALLTNIALNFVVVPRFGIVGLAAATVATAVINVAGLVVILWLRGWFAIDARLLSRLARQLAATAAMALVLVSVLPLMAPLCTGSLVSRLAGLGGLVGAGLAAFLAAALLTGALDKRRIATLGRRGRAASASLQTDPD
jgi:putative peptidoglycan lipid II flippase